MPESELSVFAQACLDAGLQPDEFRVTRAPDVVRSPGVPASRVVVVERGTVRLQFSESSAEPWLLQAIESLRMFPRKA